MADVVDVVGDVDVDFFGVVSVGGAARAKFGAED